MARQHGLSSAVPALITPGLCGMGRRFSFEELCGAELAAVDYAALGAAYHTVTLSAVPLLSTAARYGLQLQSLWMFPTAAAS